ncbi:ABC transporter permease [Pseudaestuariivita atlantica]|uniref:Glycine/betaine ABC transporter permease n=1 Tax=Pseudaestuariivita atlantica TaxID=1317121 RepID=A0A0L1JQ53_9RHOB|nr:ABC transporter permease subunit [Pseudaestuariivita atlantica]KNG93518.1 glycine/betaine ABC transporter permease [Pseudaestuariivita atlantica]
MTDAVAHPPPSEPRAGLSTRARVLIGLFGAAVILTLLRPFLPDALIRVPEWAIPPLEPALDAIFAWFQNDLGLIHVTRAISGWLGVAIDAAANLLYGKSRWPRLDALPWSAVAGVAAVLGWWLGGWKLSLLAGGTFVWTALMGQWKWTMETMSVIVIAAPVSFVIGLILGISAWKWKRFERAIRPILAILQTLPFYTYLLPAVIFFKVGPTAASVATIVYAMPPMILMTAVGLKKVPPEVVEAGKMAGCTRWQMLTRVFIPSARSEILVGLNQVIMLSLAMVVLTAFIGMPGLGAKLLAMMNSFKLGRSFEIGITIVLLAITLDRLSKAWVVKQPEHFEKGTPWWQRHFFLVLGIATFVFFLLVAQVVPYLDEIGRRQAFSMGKEIDTAMKTALAWDWVQATTNGIRYFFNLFILIPTENALLYVPTFAVIAAVAGICYALGGAQPAIIGAVFFTTVAFFGWWDRAMLTLHSTVTAVLLAVLIGMPIAIWASRSARASRGAIFVCDTAQTFPSFIYLLPAIMLFGISPITVILSILIYTMVPVIRYTIEGLRGVPVELTEAADMAGATRWQKLKNVQLPLAMPTIAVGLNQALMFAFFMVIIAAFIGTRDIGQELQRTLAGTHLGKNFVLGFSVVFMALTFDIAINAWAERRRRALGLA